MIQDLYPFSTLDGNVIPLDIIRPSGIAKEAFTFSAATTSKNLLGTTPIVVLKASIKCYVRFGATASIPLTDGTLVTNQIEIDVGDVIVCAPGATTYSVIGDSASGVLTLQYIEQWAGLTNEALISRR